MSTLYYHNPSCSKSRQGLTILQKKGLDFEIVEYLKVPLKEDDITQLFQKLGLEPIKAIRTKEEIYSKLGLAEKRPTPTEWAKIICNNPILLERPILSHENQAIIGRPPENLLKIL